MNKGNAYYAINFQKEILPFTYNELLIRIISEDGTESYGYSYPVFLAGDNASLKQEDRLMIRYDNKTFMLDNGVFVIQGSDHVEDALLEGIYHGNLQLAGQEALTIKAVSNRDDDATHESSFMIGDEN